MATVYTKTDNYGLNLYGDNDPADLRDGYNGSMHAIDTTLEAHLNRIEGVEARETHDEAVMKALLVENTVDNATAAKTKWDKAETDAAVAASKADDNTAILTALGAGTTGNAAASKTKWDKAGVDATTAIGKADSNSTILSTLGADTTGEAAANKTKWDKAASDADAAIKRVNILTGLATENIIVLGDSISYGTGASSVAQSWANRLGAYRGATVTNLAQNGAGYISEPTPFLTQLKRFTGDKDAVTRILVAGGVNDKEHVDGTVESSKLTTAVLNLLDYAKLNFPHAKIQVIPTICGTTPYTAYHSGVAPARDRIIAACNMRHVQVIPYGWEWLNGNPLWGSGDGIHPNDAGNTELLRLICEGMDGATVRNSWDYTVIPQDNHASIISQYFHVDGNTITCRVQGKAKGSLGNYSDLLQIPIACQKASGMYVPNSLNKLFYIFHAGSNPACTIGTVNSMTDQEEFYLSFATGMN